MYNWADIYSEQLKSGQNYYQLNATYAIWLLNGALYPDDDYWHHFQIQDDAGRVLIDHCHINLLELPKFHADAIVNNRQRWLQFFKDGESLDSDALPDWMNTDSMRQAMTTLSRFSEKEREYFAYQARQEYLRVQSCLEQEREQLLREKKQTEQQLLAIDEKRREAERKRGEEGQKRREEEQKRREAERKCGEEEQKRREAERRRGEEEQKRLETERREQAALAEIERLKTLLAQQQQN